MDRQQKCRLTISIRREDFDMGAETHALTDGRNDIGAVVIFTGLCRDENGRLAALELEHYPAMAEAELRRIAERAAERWPLMGLTVIHRFGLIKPGENIVLVAVSASHRQAAFDAASFIMDFLKTNAPFWKREHPANGTTGAWVEAKIDDDERRKRWEKS